MACNASGNETITDNMAKEAYISLKRTRVPIFFFVTKYKKKDGKNMAQGNV